MKFTLYTADCTGNAKNTNYPHQKVITSEADLKKAVAFDHVCALYDNFSRSDTNFQLSDVVPMDCDNDHSDDTDEWITPEKLSEMLTDVAFAVTYSRHHMLAKGSVSARPRFHVFFPTTPCKDATFHKAIKTRIYKELPFFDGNALDASRFLFGSKGEVVWHEGSLTIEDWLTLMKSNRSIPEGQQQHPVPHGRKAGQAVRCHRGCPCEVPRKGCGMRSAAGRCGTGEYLGKCLQVRQESHLAGRICATRPVQRKQPDSG